MAPYRLPSSTSSSIVSETSRREMALDALGQLSGQWMKQSRAILREHLPAMAKAVGNCETEAQKRGYLAEVRDEVSENAYWAWCYEHPGDVLGGVGEDPEADRKKADYQYTGPYVKPWDFGAEKGTLARNAQGCPITVKQAQVELFGDWTKQWQAGTSRVEGDQLQNLGPKDEVLVVEAPPPVESTWGEVAEIQVKEKGRYEKEEKRRQREQRKMMKALKAGLRRLKRQLAVLERRKDSAPTTGRAAKAKGAESPEMKVDSGYSSFAGERRKK